MKMVIAQKTHVGNERQDNQDDMGWFSLPTGEIIIVADGMGGEAGGREAAQMAISSMKEFFEEEQGPIPVLLDLSIRKANERIHAKGHCGDPRYLKMGTTVVVLLVKDNEAHMAHVGDSRIYLFRNGKLNRMTKDHSRVQKMLDDGMLGPEEAEDHPDANIIYRALGARQDVEPEVRPEPIPIQPDDLFLLCTDGLCSLVRDSEMEEILHGGGPVDTLCDNLVSAALNNGGNDNITVQIARFEEEPVVVDNIEQEGEAPVISSRSNPNHRWIIFLIVVVLLLFLGAGILMWSGGSGQ